MTLTQAELTIEELARETGMTVRNIRAHQSRGLLPPPEIRRRTGYYGPEHVARLRLISEMQSDGLNLRAIERLLERGQDAELLRLTETVFAPFETEQSEFLEEAELIERFGGALDDKVLKRAVELSLVVPLGAGRYEVPSPTLLRAGEELGRLGVPLERALDLVETTQRQSRRVAEAFVKLFLSAVWQPFDKAGRPEERWEDIVGAIERLRPLASEAVLAVFQRTMTNSVERAFGEVLEGKR